MAGSAVLNSAGKDSADNVNKPKVTDDGGYHVNIGGGRSLTELTVLINTACDRVEEAGSGAVLVLWQLATPSGTSWPGADVGVHQVNKWERTLRRVERLDVPVVAVAGGTCAGPALETLLVADHRIASGDVRIVLPINYGQFWPGMVLHRLANQLGAARARQVVLRGAEIAADRALAIALVDEVTDRADDLDAVVNTAVASLSQVSGVELAVRRRLLIEAPTTSFEDALGTHLAACDRELLRTARIRDHGQVAR